MTYDGDGVRVVAARAKVLTARVRKHGRLQGHAPVRTHKTTFKVVRSTHAAVRVRLPRPLERALERGDSSPLRELLAVCARKQALDLVLDGRGPLEEEAL